MDIHFYNTWNIANITDRNTNVSFPEKRFGCKDMMLGNMAGNSGKCVNTVIISY